MTLKGESGINLIEKFETRIQDNRVRYFTAAEPASLSCSPTESLLISHSFSQRPDVVV